MLSRRDWFVLHSENMRFWYIQTMGNLDTMIWSTASSGDESHSHPLQSSEIKLSGVQNKSLNSYVALVIRWQKISAYWSWMPHAVHGTFWNVLFTYWVSILSCGSDSWAQIPVHLTFLTSDCVLPPSNVSWIFLSESPNVYVWWQCQNKQKFLWLLSELGKFLYFAMSPLRCKFRLLTAATNFLHVLILCFTSQPRYWAGTSQLFPLMKLSRACPQLPLVSRAHPGAHKAAAG